MNMRKMIFKIAEDANYYMKGKNDSVLVDYIKMYEWFAKWPPMEIEELYLETIMRG